MGIVGAGDLGIQVAHHAESIGGIEIAGYCDDTRTPGAPWAGSRILGGLASVEETFGNGDFDELVIAIGYRHLKLRHQLYERLKDKVPFARIIHPSARIDRTASIGPGAIVYPGCIIDMYAEVGANTLLNLGVIISHDSKIGESCFLSPAVSVAGFVKVGNRVNLGIGTVIVDGVSIQSDVRTGAGAVLTKGVEEAGLYVGVPASLRS